ncbi:MAG: hypothetical protein ISR82_00390 [Candidatus Marinimicrobia bacterium]|nr:hypothetical protein [Candidatus Neomarinimicrobiota bacterium]MBL7009661.1 hypothetical protein [Candidatus Neomarinimicrobiota bacterium]MBL7029596.1 hypothetical protein [Candidatus Neomarinimicrobiota bacterium]
MRLNKTDGFTLGFVLIAAFAVLLNGFLKHQPEEPIVFTESNTLETTPQFSFSIEPSNIEESIENEPEMIVVQQTTSISFAEAFAIARNSRGPGAIFVWNGQSYTTSFAEEIVKPGETLDSTRINLVLNQPPEK